MAASLVANPAAAAGTAVADGYLDWGFKASFRAYVSTGDGNPPIAASDGAVVNSDGSFRFPVTGGTYDDETGAATVHHGGTVVFSYPAHFFEITLANPTVVLDGDGGALLADVDLTTSGGGFEPVHVEQAEIAELDTAAPVVDGGTVTWPGLPATLTATGAEAFAGFYTAGTALDPVSFVLSTDGAVSAPTVTVLPATGLDPDGATIEVSGTGFDPTEPGIYVAFGPQDGGEWWTDAGRFQVAKWVHPGGSPSESQDTLDSDGSFDTTLSVSAVYTDGNGDRVDCREVTCYVLTLRAHGLPDRSQDTATPVSFGTTPPVGSGGAAQQQITVDVAGGPLTLAVAGDAVALTGATVGGTAAGSLHPAAVEDLRGTNAGWSLVGQVGDFVGTTGTIGADQLGWTPAASVASGAGQVTPGATVGSGLGTARSLCAADPGASAGSFSCAADLTLSIPESAAPGSYAATLTLTLS